MESGRAAIYCGRRSCSRSRRMELSPLFTFTLILHLKLGYPTAQPSSLSRVPCPVSHIIGNILQPSTLDETTVKILTHYSTMDETTVKILTLVPSVVGGTIKILTLLSSTVEGTIYFFGSSYKSVGEGCRSLKISDPLPLYQLSRTASEIQHCNEVRPHG